MRKALLNSLPDTYRCADKRCIIVGAGDLGDPSIDIGPGDYVIAADGGYRYLCERGLRCDLLMGDLDSFPAGTEIPEHTQRFSPIKDDTDTMLAVKHALSLGYRHFLLYGMFGGRLDHSVGGLQTVLYICMQGGCAFAFEATQDGAHASYVTAVKNGTLVFPPTSEGYLSLFALNGDAEDVTLRGLKYPLSHAVIPAASTLGVSNEFVPGTEGSVSVGNGTLLVVKSV
ncbi:MAG: thiamine diphosphokinase [Clostridia bacterium]|nr:thiamine diphosphokinase [Clostridia bacterium]